MPCTCDHGHIRQNWAFLQSWLHMNILEILGRKRTWICIPSHFRSKGTTSKVFTFWFWDTEQHKHCLLHLKNCLINLSQIMCISRILYAACHYSLCNHDFEKAQHGMFFTTEHKTTSSNSSFNQEHLLLRLSSRTVFTDWLGLNWSENWLSSSKELRFSRLTINDAIVELAVCYGQKCFSKNFALVIATFLILLPFDTYTNYLIKNEMTLCLLFDKKLDKNMPMEQSPQKGSLCCILVDCAFKACLAPKICADKGYQIFNWKWTWSN